MEIFERARNFINGKKKLGWNTLTFQLISKKETLFDIKYYY